MENTKVSVIIPTFSTKPSTLKATLDSVIDQTYGNIEIVIVDDGSDIPFSDIQLEYKDNRIVWHRLEKNQGVAYARNAGVDISNGELIAFLDAGDLWERGKLKGQAALFFELDSPSVIYCGTMIVTGNNVKYQKPRFKGQIYDDLLVNNMI